MTKSNNEWVPGQKVKLVDHLYYEDLLLYGHECVGKELEIKAVFMDGSTEVCAVNLDGVNYCFASRILELIKTEAEKRRDEQIEDLALTLISNSRGSVRDSALARTLAVAVIDSGYIKPKRLTDQDIDLLLKNHWYVLGVTNRDFALAVELYVQGELDL